VRALTEDPERYGAEYLSKWRDDLSTWLSRELLDAAVARGVAVAPPPVDLGEERRNGEFVRILIEQERVTAAHDISDGGLAVALAEMAIASSIGAAIAVPSFVPQHAYLFGEDQARYVLTAVPDQADAIRGAAKAAGINCEIIGATGGDTLALGGAPAILVGDVARSFEAWLPSFMAGKSL
jgi:phosphoribosylformylglycinamidine (FGAM) synthase-like enzyme